MKRLAQACKVFFTVCMGACLAVFPAYVHFYNLTEADVFRTAHVENHPLGDHLANLEKKWEGFGVADHSQIFSENSNFNLYPVLFQALSSSKDYSPLRC
ncbi:MAG: hypothetical protein ABSF48_19015 [Thermodesulfobacteriota bacterium]|jgi:hypothetical protein